MSLRLVQVDAFADRPFSGNPAAVMPLDRWLDDAVLQAIAAENNLAETAFLVPAEGDADYDLRWFTPTVEVALCGHATLASGHVLLGDDAALNAIRFRTRQSGILEVVRADRGYALTLPATRVAPATNDRLLAALDTPGAPSFLSVDGAQDVAIVLLPDAGAVRAVAPDFAALAALGLMAIVTAPGDDCDIVSRVFAPAWGIDEDPVTGSAHAALVPFWADKLGRDHMTAWQASARGGRLDCRVAGDRVILGGTCITMIEGRFFL
jgi:PhzF family phenazine biosynthesis protein